MFTSLKKKLFGSAAAAQPNALLKATAPAEDASAPMKRGNESLGQGRLDDALQCYQQALALAPDHAGALINLAFVFTELQRFAEARPLLERAVLLDPVQDDALYLLATVDRHSGREVQAVENLHAALALKPDFTACRLELCQLLFDRGERDAVGQLVEAGIAIEPNSADLHFCLGNLQLASGAGDKAAASFETTIALAPAHDAARRQLGAIRHAQGELNAALRAYQSIRVSVATDDAARWLNLGVAFHDRGALAAAQQCYESAIALHPSLFEAHNNLGTVCQSRGDLPASIGHYRTALAMRPDSAQGHGNLAMSLHRQGKVADAVRSYEAAIALDPGDADMQSSLGTALQVQGKLSAAAKCYRDAIALDSKHVNARSNLGSVLEEMGEHNAAIESLRTALAIDPNYADAQNTLLFALNYHPDQRAEDIFDAYREYDQRVGLPLRGSWTPHTNALDSNRRLKVGYVSPDFRQHAVRHFLEPLVAHHDKRAVEVFAYAELSTEDTTTSRFRAYADHWTPTVALSDDALAERIRADGIDILVDLAGHTANNRLRVFARKPAPVSLSWLGFGYTTGLSAIDYLLTDDACVPDGSESLFSEQPWRLAPPGFVYRPAEGMGEVNALPSSERGFVTFGTLTRAVRVNHRTIEAWSQILQRVPMSRLVVDSNTYQDPNMQEKLLAKFAAHRIGPERLQIGFHSPPWDVLRSIDIGLDCFPHNSGTTLFETLYMGLPFVTLAGRPSVGRLGSSILIGVGHPEWIAHSEDEYVEKCVALANDLPALAALRAGLRDQMRASALMDEAGFARKVETAYREMFSRWATGPGQP